MVGKGHLQAGVCVAYGLSGVLYLVFLQVLIVILCSFFFFFYWVVSVFFFLKYLFLYAIWYWVYELRIILPLLDEENLRVDLLLFFKLRA